MPNYVRNIVTISGDKETIKKAKRSLIKKGNFSFNNVIPMPKSLAIESSSSVEDAIDAIKKGRKAIAEFKKKQDKWHEGMGGAYIKLGHIALKNIEKYGAKDWYDWSRYNWGTKWDACDVEVETAPCEIKLVFETAWNTPVPVFNAIAKKFPTLAISVEYADEDLGYNCGTIVYEDGEMYGETEGDEEFASDIWGL